MPSELEDEMKRTTSDLYLIYILAPIIGHRLNMADVLHPLGYARVPSRRASQQEMKASAAQEAGPARTLHGQQPGQLQVCEHSSVIAPHACSAAP